MKLVDISGESANLNFAIIYLLQECLTASYTLYVALLEALHVIVLLDNENRRHDNSFVPHKFIEQHAQIIYAQDTHIIWIPDNFVAFRIEIAQQQNLGSCVLRCALLQIQYVAIVHPENVIVIGVVILVDLQHTYIVECHNIIKSQIRLHLSANTHLPGPIVIRQIVLLHRFQSSFIGLTANMPRSNGRTIDGPLLSLTSFYHGIDENGFGNRRTTNVTCKSEMNFTSI